MDLKLAAKVTSVLSGDTDRVVVDATDANNPKVSLTAAVIAKIDAVTAKLNAIVSADSTKLSIDLTSPQSPKISLGSDTTNKLETMWTLTNNGTGVTVIPDASIDQIFTDVFK